MPPKRAHFFKPRRRQIPIRQSPHRMQNAKRDATKCSDLRFQWKNKVHIALRALVGYVKVKTRTSPLRHTCATTAPVACVRRAKACAILRRAIDLITHGENAWNRNPAGFSSLRTPLWRVIRLIWDAARTIIAPPGCGLINNRHGLRQVCTQNCQAPASFRNLLSIPFQKMRLRVIIEESE